MDLLKNSFMLKILRRKGFAERLVIEGNGCAKKSNNKVAESIGKDSFNLGLG